MILLSVLATFTSVDEHTHKKWWFDVPEGLNKLIVKFSFSPYDDGGEGLDDIIKTLKHDAPYYQYSEKEAMSFLPLRNHFGVSVDSPNGWIGTAHRHNPNQCHTISKEFSDNGFLYTEITAGRWGVTLSLNAVVTKEVFVKLTVEGEI